MNDILTDLLQDGFFAAIAAVGFASISNPPRRAYPCCALLAAMGHAVRHGLMQEDLLGMHIIGASTLAAFCIGMLAVWLANIAKCPAETCFFPSLLPMIPGMYAYRTVEALAMCLYYQEEAIFNHWFYLLVFNGFTCTFIILGMVVGANIPIFLFKKISFKVTKQSSAIETANHHAAIL